jgi:hypothetical protein
MSMIALKSSRKGAPLCAGGFARRGLARGVGFFVGFLVVIAMASFESRHQGAHAGGVLQAKDRYQLPRRPPAQGADTEQQLWESRRGRLRAELRELGPKLVGQRTDQRGNVRR